VREEQHREHTGAGAELEDPCASEQLRLEERADVVVA
jgi:hypothetical protein